MKRKLFVAGLLAITLMLMVSVYPVLTIPGESQGKQKTQYIVSFDNDHIDGSGTATVVNQWGMGCFGIDRITLDFGKNSVFWGGDFNGQPIDFTDLHRGEMGLHTKDKGTTVLMKFGFKIDGYQNEFVLKATCTVDDWMADSFTIAHDGYAVIMYKKFVVWSKPLSFTITCTKDPA